MSLKDATISWYIQHVLVPSVEIIDKPGFIITRAAKKGSTAYLRVLFLPEQVFIRLEEAGKKDEEVERALYSAGKKFGATWANLADFPKASKTPRGDFLNFISFLVQYVGVTYATKASHKVDLDTKRFEFEAEEYVVCRRSGLGAVLGSGGISGIWASLLEEPRIEGVQATCRGRGDKNCRFICAPKKTLQAEGYAVLEEPDLPVQGASKEYLKMNQVRVARHAKNSLKTLLDSGIFKSKDGKMLYGEERYLLCESHLVYLLEEQLRGAGEERLLFDAAFDYGKALAGGVKQQAGQFLADYLSALGWGDVLVSKVCGKYRVSVDCYPWVEGGDTSNFTFFSGLASGALSVIANKTVRLRKKETSTTHNALGVVFEEAP